MFTLSLFSFFFFNATATTETYTYCHTLSLHDALPICQQKRHGASVAGVHGDETLQCNHERGHAALHVRRAAAVEHAVADFRYEGVAGPGLAWAGRHHV